MIEANRYSNETIHVANWLLLSGQEDLEKMRADAIAESQKWVRWAEADEDEQEEMLFDGFVEAIEGAIKDVIVQTAAPGWFVYEAPYFDDEESYRASGPDGLVLPMLFAALSNVSWEDVATLILSHRWGVYEGNGTRILDTVLV